MGEENLKKNFLLYLLIYSLIFTATSPIAEATQQTENVIIVFKDHIDKIAITNVNGEFIEQLDNFSVAAVEMPASGIPLLEKNEEILSVEPDQRIQINGQIEDWGIEAVKANLSWQSSYTGKGIKIAVLDTGISTHEDLEIAGGVSMTSYTNVYKDDNGHGTHVAGIIGAKNNGYGSVGVAPDANLYAVKVLDKSGAGYLSDILAGIDWAITNKMDIINLSLGVTGDSRALRKAIENAEKNGILVVASAGNSGREDGSGDSIEYPARYDSVIGVGAIDQEHLRASFSATGSTMDVTAPGVKILSTYLNNQYAIMSGTSMSTPYVAGILALWKQQNPTYTHHQLREKLTASSIDLGITGKDSYYGYGLVQGPFQVQESSLPIVSSPSNPAKEDILPISEEKVVNSEPVSNPDSESVIEKPQSSKAVMSPKSNTKPAAIRGLRAQISGNQSTYHTGETINILLTVVDKQTSNPVGHHPIGLRVVNPDGRVSRYTLKTNSKGEAYYQMVITNNLIKGDYVFTSSAYLTANQEETTTKVITIK
jgi:minor extracellular protease Epr